MTKLKQAALAAAVAAAMAVPGISMAQSRGETGWYVGASIGQAEAKDGCSGLPAGISCDEKDTSWKILGGYQFNQTFGAEFAYTDLGEVSASGLGLTASAEATAWELVGVAKFPVANQFSIYGKAGLYMAQVDFTSNFAGSDDDNSSGLTFGFGGQYDLNRNVGLRAEWQRYSDVGGDNTGGESDVDVLSIGVLFKF